MTDQIQEPDIEAKQNFAREAAAMIPVDRGVVRPQDFSQMADRAKFMATSKEAIPAHMRGNVGMCIAIHEMAGDWGFRPYGVANLSYVVNNKLGFESQLMIAVINKHGGLTQRLRPSYEGTGENMICIVRGQFNGEVDPCEYRSPPIGTIKPKNSPLWLIDPQRQLFYYSARGFIRMFCPQIMLGIFGYDELQDNPHIGADNAKDVTDAAVQLHERLSTAARNNNGEGFRPGVVDEALNGKTPLPSPESPPEAKPTASQAATEQSGQPATRRKRRTKAEMEAARAATGEISNDASVPQESEVMPHSGPHQAETPHDTPPPSEPDIQAGAPTTVESYTEYARVWISEAVDPKAALKKWAAENDLRNDLAVPVDQRIILREQIASKFERPS